MNRFPSEQNLASPKIFPSFRTGTLRSSKSFDDLSSYNTIHTTPSVGPRLASVEPEFGKRADNLRRLLQWCQLKSIPQKLTGLGKSAVKHSSTWSERANSALRTRISNAKKLVDGLIGTIEANTIEEIRSHINSVEQGIDLLSNPLHNFLLQEKANHVYYSKRITDAHDEMIATLLNNMEKTLDNINQEFTTRLEFNSPFSDSKKIFALLSEVSSYLEELKSQLIETLKDIRYQLELEFRKLGNEKIQAIKELNRETDRNLAYLEKTHEQHRVQHQIYKIAAAIKFIKYSGIHIK